MFIFIDIDEVGVVNVLENIWDILNNVLFNINGSEIYVMSSFGVSEVNFDIDIFCVVCWVD